MSDGAGEVGDVVLVRWPAEGARLTQLRAEHVPRLLMVEPDAEAPDPDSGLQDWIRLPASPGDVRVRVEGLLARARAADAVRPTMDDAGVVRFRGVSVGLSPNEVVLFDTLLDRWQGVVGRDTLAPLLGAAGSRNALDACMSRLRRRLASVGLRVRTVRSRGYLLEPAAVSGDRTPATA
ncbi:MAG: helix-turn-helix domain-containing protein [Acidimicrobiales bacterium]